MENKQGCENMYVNFKLPEITMELYETDIQVLYKFISSQEIDGEITEEYQVLYNFATDCKYSKNIQPELIRYLLPFYLKAAEQTVLYNNKITRDVYYEFNTAMFFNNGNFKSAAGIENYNYIMSYYIKYTIKKMEIHSNYMPGWISLFNTTIALCNDNIIQLFGQVFQGSLIVKYSFFQYLSVLLFKESDNLLAANGAKPFWTSDIWDFDDGYCLGRFVWNNYIVGIFDKEINRERIESLSQEVKPLICDIFGSVITSLFCDEMDKSFETGIFYKRKNEYLRKINNASEKDLYWDLTF